MVKKAHLVTGKGGVGKSLFSAALAYTLSLENKPILLAEMNDDSFYRDFLNLSKINYKPSRYKNNLDIAQWAPNDCLKEYALHLLKIESLYKLFVENPVTKSLIEIAPGLKDLALLGKLTSSPRRHGPLMNYEQIVVDAYSTGHFLALLRAPGALHEAVPFGPMGEQTKSIDYFIRDQNFTQIHLVSLPEELPVTETVELYTQLKNEFGLKPLVYLNKTWPLEMTDLQGLHSETKESLAHIITNQEIARTTFKKENIEIKELPYIFNTDVETVIAEVSQLLKGHV